MSTVYIAGPVVRHDALFEDQSERSQIYNRIYETLTAAGIKVIVPVSNETTENAEPRAFFQIMRDRIAASDLVITVFPERNRSVPVEATIASVMNKPQYVVAGDIESVPRILKGLPGVVLVTTASDIDRVLDELQLPFEPPLSTPTWGRGEDEGDGPLAAQDYTQAAINEGQRKINYALTIVDRKLVKAIEALAEALAKTSGSSRMNLDEAKVVIKEAYESSRHVADMIH